MPFYYSQRQLDNATDPRWSRKDVDMLNDREAEEVGALADELDVSFDEAFSYWLEGINEENNDCWGLV